MKRSKSVVVALVGSSLLAEWAIAVDYGSFHVGPAETKEIVIGPTARELRVCNDFESGGTLIISLGGHEPHVLRPGLCADDIGDTITASNQGGGQAMGTWGLSYGHNGNDKQRFRSR
jgi:hypothetical protein